MPNCRVVLLPEKQPAATTRQYPAFKYSILAFLFSHENNGNMMGWGRNQEIGTVH